jgi:hypothetical protein
VWLDLNDVAARAAFFAAVNTIGSDHDRADVLSNVLRKPWLVPETVVAAIDSATAMGSDEDKASVLLLAAERRASYSTVRAAPERALQSVHSDGDSLTWMAAVPLLVFGGRPRPEFEKAKREAPAGGPERTITGMSSKQAMEEGIHRITSKKERASIQYLDAAVEADARNAEAFLIEAKHTLTCASMKGRLTISTERFN